MAIYDAQMWIFGLITSKIPLSAWVRAVGGALKHVSDIHEPFAITPFLSHNHRFKERNRISSRRNTLKSVQNIPEKTLAEMYNPDKMPQVRDATISYFDLIVESCYRKEPFIVMKSDWNI